MFGWPYRLGGSTHTHHHPPATCLPPPAYLPPAGGHGGAVRRVVAVGRVGETIATHWRTAKRGHVDCLRLAYSGQSLLDVHAKMYAMHGRVDCLEFAWLVEYWPIVRSRG